MKKFVVVALLSGCLAACGSRTEQTVVAKAVTATCDATKNQAMVPAKLIPLKLQLPWFANGEHSYAFLGKRLNIFAANGFDVEVITGRGSDVAARALAAGQVDAAIIGGDAMTLVNQEGASLRSVGIVYRQSPVTIYSLPGSGIDSKKPESLYGKRVGLMPGSNTVTQYEGFASMMNLDRSKIIEVSVQPQQAPGMVIAKLPSHGGLNGDSTLDALVHYSQFAPLEAKVRYNLDMNEMRLADFDVKILGMVLAIQADKMPESNIANLSSAIRTAFDCARKNPEAAIDALAFENPNDEFGREQDDRRFAVAQLEALLSMSCKGRGESCEGFLDQNETDWADTIQTLRKFGLLKKDYKPRDLMYSVTVRPS